MRALVCRRYGPPEDLELAIRQANPWKMDQEIEALVFDFAAPDVFLVAARLRPPVLVVALFFAATAMLSTRLG